MKRKTTRIFALIIFLFVIATIVAQIRVHRFYEDNFGIEKQYYGMEEAVPFGENLIEKNATLDGCFIRLDRAEILTGSELLERVGQTESSLTALLGREVTSVSSERLCLLTVAICNDSSEDRNFDLGDFTLTGVNYDVHFDHEYTILANRFLLDAHQDELDDFWGAIGETGVHLYPGHKAELHFVYAFSKMDFSSRKWDQLKEESLWLRITYEPVEKYITLELS